LQVAWQQYNKIMNKQLFKNPQGSFPLSTDTVDFMQNQILLVEKITTVFGRNVMIKLPLYHGSSAPSENGLMIFDGELVEVAVSIGAFSDINITKLDLVETKESINALGEVFNDVRILHHVVPRKAYIGTPPNHTVTTPYPGTIKTISYTDCIKLDGIEIASLIKPAYEERVPKGAIIMWSGSIDNIPTGYALCDGENGTPDLRGKFIVGYDPSDDDYNEIGEFGGEKYSVRRNKGNLPDGFEIDQNDYLPGITNDRYAFDNRPPYYVLAFIIKTI